MKYTIELDRKDMVTIWHVIKDFLEVNLEQQQEGKGLLYWQDQLILTGIMSKLAEQIEQQDKKNNKAVKKEIKKEKK